MSSEIDTSHLFIENVDCKLHLAVLHHTRSNPEPKMKLSVFTFVLIGTVVATSNAKPFRKPRERVAKPGNFLVPKEQ